MLLLPFLVEHDMLGKPSTRLFFLTLIEHEAAKSMI